MPQSATPAASSRAPLAFLSLFAISLAISRPLHHTLALAWSDDRYTHILLILPIVAALTFMDWRDILDFAVPQNPSSRRQRSLALSSFSLLAALAAWERLGAVSSLSLTARMLGLVFFWIVAVLICFGATGLRTLLFPALFSFWLVPLPSTVVDRIVTLLQIGSAWAAEGLFWMARVPVTRENIVLYIPGVEIEVASECSSIRSSMILIVMTMLLAQLLLRSPWRKFIVIAAAVPLSIAKNGLRIFVIAMLGTRVDESYWTGSFHHHGGVVFLIIALAATIFLIWILRRGEARSA